MSAAAEAGGREHRQLGEAMAVMMFGVMSIQAHIALLLDTISMRLRYIS
jgi:hypothetical protein